MGSEEIGSIPYNVEDMSICSGSMIFKPPSEVDPFYRGFWDANVLGNAALVHKNELANPHYPVVSEKQTVGNSSHFVPFTAGLLLVDKVRKSHENCQNSEDGALGSLSNAKRKRENAEVEQQNEQNVDTCEFPKQDERKNIGPNSRGKQATKQMKANSNGAEPSKENYILVRAKRGQATSSHSLAERLRREKISERMKLLQELVPGCNKITGKAMMLDEIINYVQSLQQQVEGDTLMPELSLELKKLEKTKQKGSNEMQNYPKIVSPFMFQPKPFHEFLSMKLATVNPELNVDIDHILMKDLLHPHPGLDPGLGSSLAFSGLHNGTINGYRGMAPPSHPLSRNSWNNELQSILQTRLDSTPSQASLGANGNLLKPTNRIDD